MCLPIASTVPVFPSLPRPSTRSPHSVAAAPDLAHVAPRTVQLVLVLAPAAPSAAPPVPRARALPSSLPPPARPPSVPGRCENARRSPLCSKITPHPFSLTCATRTFATVSAPSDGPVKSLTRAMSSAVDALHKCTNSPGDCEGLPPPPRRPPARVRPCRRVLDLASSTPTARRARPYARGGTARHAGGPPCDAQCCTPRRSDLSC